MYKSIIEILTDLYNNKIPIHNALYKLEMEYMTMLVSVCDNYREHTKSKYTCKHCGSPKWMHTNLKETSLNF